MESSRVSSHASAIAAARASLSDPSRPFTPAEPSRPLFRAGGGSGMGLRPPVPVLGSGGSGGIERPTMTPSQSRPTSSYTIGRADFASSLGGAFAPSILGSGAEVLSFDSHNMSASMPCTGVAAASISSAAAFPEPKENVMPQVSKLQEEFMQPPPTPPPPQQQQQQQQAPAATASASSPAAWWSQTEALLRKLVPGGTLEDLNRTSDALWERLRPPAGPEGPAASRSTDEEEVQIRRQLILSAVAALMDWREPQLLLRLCRLILGVCGSDKNAQLGACKLLFKLSKMESNDRRFREYHLLPLLLETLSGAEEAETLLYAAATLKNTSADAANQKALVSLGAVAVFANAVRAECAKLLRPTATTAAAAAPAATATAVSNGGGASSFSSSAKGVKPVHVLVQLTATLRNVAVSGSSRKQFVQSGCVEELCALLRAAPHQADLCLNVSRVLAKLTLHEDVRARIDDNPERLDGLLHALSLHAAYSAPLLIRLCFILGNLSASNDNNREVIAKAVLPLLLRLLDECTSSSALAALSGAASPAASSTIVGTSTADELLPAPSVPRSAKDEAEAASASVAVEAERGGGGCRDGGAVDAGSQSERIDVLVKLIRLVAHLAISPDTGRTIAASAASLSLLRVLTHFSMEGHEELQLNAVSAVTNITYYLTNPSHLLRSHESLCAALVPVLVFPNTEGMVEAARALGNLSRLPDARQTICKARMHEALLLLLDHSSSQVAEASCGALINLAADLATRHLLLGAHAAPRLADLLLLLLTPRISSAATRSDIGAALLAIKTLCNLCCTCEEASPLSTREITAMRQGLTDESVAASWARLPDATEMLSEWPQATALFGELLDKLFPLAEAEEKAMLGKAFAEEQDEYEELDELSVS